MSSENKGFSDTTLALADEIAKAAHQKGVIDGRKEMRELVIRLLESLK